MSPDLAKAARLAWFLLAPTVVAVGLAPAQAVLRTFPLQNVFDVAEVIGDIDGDGVRDLAIHRSTLTGTGRIDVYSVRTGALLHQWVPPTLHYYSDVQRVGDVDGDGLDDVSYSELRYTGTPSRFAVIRSGVTGQYIHQINGGAEFAARSLDDVNGDGRNELILSNSSATVGGLLEAGRVDIVDGATLQVLWSHVGTSAQQGLLIKAVVGDLDGDGARDYVLFDAGVYASSRLYRVFSGRTGAAITTFPPQSYSYGLDMVDIGDFNADGFDDIILADHGNPPAWGYHGTYVLGGPSLTQILWQNVFVWGAPPNFAVGDHGGRLGDLDGDGHADLVLQGGLAGDRVSLLAGRDASTLGTLPSSAFGAWFVPAAKPSPGDVDGDGFPDYWLTEDLVSGVVRVLHLVSGAPPGVTRFGSGCVDQTGHEPVIGVGVGARLGKDLTINLSNANPQLLAAVLGLGYSNTSWGGVPLPFGLAAFGMPGCTWHVAGDVTLTLPTVGQNGTRHHATHTITVPQQSALLGLDAYAQWLVLEAGVTGLAGSTTRAIRTTVVP